MDVGLNALAALVVGMMVGATGVGGGAVMTDPTHFKKYQPALTVLAGTIMAFSSP